MNDNCLNCVLSSQSECALQVTQVKTQKHTLRHSHIYTKLLKMFTVMFTRSNTRR